MTIPSEPRTPRLYHASDAAAGPAFSPVVALTILAVGMATFLASGIVGGSLHAPALVILVISELAFVTIPVLWLWRHGLGTAAIGLRRAAPGAYVAALLIGGSAWYLNTRLVDLLPLPEADLAQLADLVDRPPLVAALIAIAVVPAVCEEIVFRGVLLRALSTRFIPAAAITMSAAVFAAYHLSVVQLVPTFTLGLGLGVITYRWGSIGPAILAHLLNNGLAVAVARRDLPGTSWLERHPRGTLMVAACATTAGLVLALRPRPERRR